MYFFDVDPEGRYPFSEAVIDSVLLECIAALMATESIPFEEAAVKIGCSGRKAAELKRYVEEV